MIRREEQDIYNRRRYIFFFLAGAICLIILFMKCSYNDSSDKRPTVKVGLYTLTKKCVEVFIKVQTAEPGRETFQFIRYRYRIL